jgi:hypothetical protein
MVAGPPWDREEAVAEAKELRRRGLVWEEVVLVEEVEDWRLAKPGREVFMLGWF